MKTVTLYTDGACSGNPGPGGWGAIVSYNGFEKELLGAEVLDEPVVTDGNITTAFGAGAAFDFGFRLLSELDGDPKNADALRKSMKYNK